MMRSCAAFLGRLTIACRLVKWKRPVHFTNPTCWSRPSSLAAQILNFSRLSQCMMLHPLLSLLFDQPQGNDHPCRSLFRGLARVVAFLQFFLNKVGLDFLGSGNLFWERSCVRFALDTRG